METRMESQRENQEIEIDLLELSGILLGRIGLILNIGFLAAVLCFILSRFVLTPVYESTTKIYILNKTESASVTYSDVQMGTQLTKDYAELIGSRYVLEEVIQKLGLEDMAYNDLLDTVSVTTPTDTRIVSITVENTDPALAMNIANCIREVAGEHIQNVMDIEAVNVVETANMPVKKAGPSVFRWTLIGGAAGILLVCVIVLVQYLMDDTVKSAEDVEKHLGLSTLALIPLVEDAEERKKTGKRKRKKAS
ncbi:MAG: Wzz/FepE/Etk N-terminal domain-containing protein [Lachnospiraceae bacterium]|nr:Wzz/FepE/Etk N-terminal domain-containing protein [Lachnospiraceae bacterium]